MSELTNRIFKYLQERRQRVLEGEINCIPLPFYRFKQEFPGIEQSKFYLVTGTTKSAKTQLANYLFVYNTILYSFYHPDVIKPKIFYYALEETKENITLRFMSFLLYTFDNIRISPTDLTSTDKDKPVSKDILELLNTKKYTDILSYYEKVVDFRPGRNPTAIWKDAKSYAEANGTVHTKKSKYIDDFGVTRDTDAFDYYEPNNQNEYVFVIVDHISLIDTELKLSLREAINKVSEYMVVLRNRYHYIPVLIQQQSTETSSLEAFKANKIRPTVAGLSDSKYTARDVDVMIGITNPYFFELPEYLGYDITKLKGNFRIMEIVLNRGGQSNGICPLVFDGAINWFKEAPLPTDTSNIAKIYQHLKQIRENNNNNNNKINNEHSFMTFITKIFSKGVQK
jgi:hypothetical protein